VAGIQAAQSKNEENTYQALQKLKVEFEFQKPISGGRLVRGGQVLDFVLHIPPRPVALYIDGLYWHKADAEDQIKHAEAERMGYRVEIISEEASSTVEKAVDALRKIL
jgi:hypothetical protein